MSYIEQSHRALRLYLSYESDDIKRFEIIVQNEIVINDISIRYGILGESHFVSVTRESLTFNEIFACTDASIPKAEHISLAEVTKTPVIRTPKNTLEYTFKATIVSTCADLSFNEPHHTHSTVVKSLQHTFPNDTGTLAAKTKLILLTKKHSITVETIHTYPNESLAVHSQSSFHYVT